MRKCRVHVLNTRSTAMLQQIMKALNGKENDNEHKELTGKQLVELFCNVYAPYNGKISLKVPCDVRECFPCHEELYKEKKDKKQQTHHIGYLFSQREWMRAGEGFPPHPLSSAPP